MRNCGLGYIQFVDDIVNADPLAAAQRHDLLAGFVSQSFGKFYGIESEDYGFHIEVYLFVSYSNRSLSICQAGVQINFQAMLALFCTTTDPSQLAPPMRRHAHLHKRARQRVVNLPDD